MEYLSGELNDSAKAAFEKYLEENPGQLERFTELQRTWNQMDRIPTPEPSREMDERFYTMLSEQKEKSKREGFFQEFKKSLGALMTGLAKPQLAYGIVLLGIGLGTGYYLNSGSPIAPVKTEVVSTSETEEVREKLVLTLLEQPSANKRLQGVSEANKFNKVDEKVIRALLQTLNNDPNVNVRLAAIESLTNYLDDPVVRQGLVASIVQQESPIVQVTLANLMVALQEKKSIAPFKKLMQTKDLDNKVKQQLERSIQSII
ncbi:MAG: HEAT repeat domain-containing protein [Saonia sp.]